MNFPVFFCTLQPRAGTRYQLPSGVPLRNPQPLEFFIPPAFNW